MSNVAFDPTRYYQIAQDIAGVLYIVQDGNWFSQKTQVPTLIVPNGWKFLPQGASATYPGLLPNVLAQSGIPLILPSSGTLSASGALSGITALAGTYPNCWMFFPANAIATVSPAGMYFVQMSSTTAGTAFQNILTAAGTALVPFVPAASALIPCTTASSYTTGTGANVAACIITLSGGSMGAKGRVRLTGSFSNNNSAGAKIGQLGFGATTVGGANNTTNIVQPVMHDVFNRGVTNAQQTIAGSGYVASATALTLGANDTTGDLSLQFFLQVAVATDTCQWDAILIEVVPGA